MESKNSRERIEFVTEVSIIIRSKTSVKIAGVYTEFNKSAECLNATEAILCEPGGESENSDRTKGSNSRRNKIKVLAYPLGDFRYECSLRVARCYGIALSLMRDIDWLFLSFRPRWEFKNLVCNFSPPPPHERD